MADLDRAQKVEGGIILDPAGAGVFQDSFDPTAGGGFGAVISSLFLRNTTGQAFRKTGAGDTDWTEIDVVPSNRFRVMDHLCMSWASNQLFST